MGALQGHQMNTQGFCPKKGRPLTEDKFTQTQTHSQFSRTLCWKKNILSFKLFNATNGFIYNKI